MIVKVAPKRRDKSTSFSDLQKYITEGFDREVDIREISFNDLTQYISGTEVLDGMGSMVDKTIAIEIGNLNSLRTAASEMYATAMRNKRCDDPVLHYILSWPENEKPEIEQIIAAGRYTLGALGLSDHQYIIAIHANTDNIHAHIEVNRVHPKTYKAKHLEWLHKSLHKAAREIEIQFSWSHDNGLYVVVEVDGKKFIVPNDSYVDPEVAAISTRAKHHEVWSGSESFETWLKKNVASSLKNKLAERNVEWSDVHNLLNDYGVRIEEAGSGFVIVNNELEEGSDTSVAIAASRVFRFMKKTELEKQMGTFSQRQDFSALNDSTEKQQHEKTYKRDPLQRLVRRLERKEARDALIKRYKEYEISARGLRKESKDILTPIIQASQNKRVERIRLQYMARREKIRKDRYLTKQTKQQAYMLLKLTHVQAMKELRNQFASERRSAAEEIPNVKSWRSWVEEEASLGDEAAISALRGIVYQEGRDAKKGLKEEGKGEVSIVPTEPLKQSLDKVANDIDNLSWRVTGNGRIVYSIKGKEGHAFIDNGSNISFGKRIIDNDELNASLSYIKLKWHNGITIQGGDHVFKQRLLRHAVEHGIKVNNPELQALQKQLVDSKRRRDKGIAR